MGLCTLEGWVLYTRRGCHLCETAEDWLDAVGLPRAAFPDRYVDVDGDPEIARLYGERVPVLVVDGRVAAEGRIAEGDLLRAVGPFVTGPALGRGGRGRR